MDIMNLKNCLLLTNLTRFTSDFLTFKLIIASFLLPSIFLKMIMLICLSDTSVLDAQKKKKNDTSVLTS